MKNKISTFLGFTIIFIVSITIALFVINYLKLYPQAKQDIPQIKKDVNEVTQAEIPVTEDMTQSQAIKTGVYNKLRYKNTSVDNIIIESSNDKYAYGRFDYQSGGSTNKDNIWFATKEDKLWNVIHLSYVGYFGYCSVFEKSQFPEDMIPDCWDEKSNVLVETKNPSAFYKNGFRKEDKKLLLSTFLKYVEKYEQDSFKKDYSDKTLYVRVDSNTQNHLRGTILREGIENISRPNFYAIREGKGWKVLYNGQDYPLCKDMDQYQFPSEVLKDCIK